MLETSQTMMSKEQVYIRHLNHSDPVPFLVEPLPKPFRMSFDVKSMLLRSTYNKIKIITKGFP